MQGVNVLLMGPSGSGKTHAIRTFLEVGITPFCIFTEPGYETLGDLPPEKCHWHYLPPAVQSWETMIDVATKINNLSFESLTKLGDMNKRDNAQIIEFYKLCNNFVCQRDGRSYGDVAKWGTDRVLVVDSLTGLNDMAMGLMVGNKPVRSQSDWGIAQNTLDFCIKKLTMDTKCHFVLIGHVEREVDEVLGGNKIAVSTLGKKLAPKLPLNFSDVILSEKKGTAFTWSTANAQADLKTRNLANREGLPPTFVPIIESWKKHGGVVSPTAAS
jgi:hypothetical protein